MSRAQDSADLLRDAMAHLAAAGRRSNPGVRYELLTQAPEQQQPWVPDDSDGYASFDAAMDAAQWLAGRALAGTAVQIRHGDDELPWLGVVGRGGELLATPSLPSPPNGAADWLQAWESPAASADWMLYQCEGVEAWMVAMAACAVVRAALPSAGDQRLAALAAVKATELWARKGGPPPRRAGNRAQRAYEAMRGSAANEAAGAVLLAASDATQISLMNERQRPSDSLSQEGASAAGLTAEDAAWGPWWASIARDGMIYGTGDEGEAAWREAWLRDQAHLVRRWVPLGLAMLGRLEAEAREAREVYAEAEAVSAGGR